MDFFMIKILTLIFLAFTININVANAADIKKAQLLKSKASGCYLSLPSHYQSSVSKLYLDGNKFLRDGIKYTNMGQAGLANTFIGHSINMYKNMLSIGRQVGSKRC